MNRYERLLNKQIPSHLKIRIQILNLPGANDKKQSDIGGILSNFVQIVSRFFKEANSFFNKKTLSDKKIEKILSDISEILKTDISHTLATNNKTLQLHGKNLSDEQTYYQQMNMFLKTLPAGIITSLNNKLSNMESSLNSLLTKMQKDVNASTVSTAKSENDTNTYLDSYSTVFEQFNQALSITADELLNFKNKIIGELNSIIDNQKNSMESVYADENTLFLEKINIIIQSLNILVESRLKNNALDQTNIKISIDNLVDQLNKINSNLLSNNKNIDEPSITENNSNINTTYVNNDTKNESTTIYYTIPDNFHNNLYDDQQITDSLTHFDSQILIESPELSNQIDTLIDETKSINENVVKSLFVNNDFSEFNIVFERLANANKELFSRFYNKNTDTNAVTNIQSNVNSLKQIVINANDNLLGINKQLISIKGDVLNNFTQSNSENLDVSPLTKTDTNDTIDKTNKNDNIDINSEKQQPYNIYKKNNTSLLTVKKPINIIQQPNKTELEKNKNIPPVVTKPQRDANHISVVNKTIKNDILPKNENIVGESLSPTLDELILNINNLSNVLEKTNLLLENSYKISNSENDSLKKPVLSKSVNQSTKNIFVSSNQEKSTQPPTTKNIFVSGNQEKSTQPPTVINNTTVSRPNNIKRYRTNNIKSTSNRNNISRTQKLSNNSFQQKPPKIQKQKIKPLNNTSDIPKHDTVKHTDVETLSHAYRQNGSQQMRVTRRQRSLRDDDPKMKRKNIFSKRSSRIA